jgi:hypothetical protein
MRFQRCSSSAICNGLGKPRMRNYTSRMKPAQPAQRTQQEKKQRQLRSELILVELAKLGRRQCQCTAVEPPPRLQHSTRHITLEILLRAACAG